MKHTLLFLTFLLFIAGQCVIYAKTGWAHWSPADIGWFVGFVECGERTLFFVLNMDIEYPEQAAERKVITYAILREFVWM